MFATLPVAFSFLKPFDVDAEGNRTDHFLRRRINNRQAQLGLIGQRRFVFFHVADMNGVGIFLEGLLPFVFVTLPVVGGDFALADIEAVRVHDENFGVQTIGVGLLLLQQFGQVIV